MSVHVNAPADSKKDGPSAGAAITLAMLSALLGVKVRREYAMTGKIGLQGQILPIGGVKEKLQGALNSGATTILIPKGNEKDLADVPESIKSKLLIRPVSRIEEVLQFALTERIPGIAEGPLVESFKTAINDNPGPLAEPDLDAKPKIMAPAPGFGLKPV